MHKDMSLCIHIHNDLLQLPDVLHVLLDGAVGRELSAVRHIQDCGLRPPLLIAVCLLHVHLCHIVGAEILEDEVGIGAVAEKYRTWYREHRTEQGKR